MDPTVTERAPEAQSTMTLVPTPVERQQRKRLERELQLSRLAQGIAPFLYTALHYHMNGNGSGRPWELASERDRQLCRDVAEQAVMAVNEFRVRQAEMHARIVVQDAIEQIKWQALKKDQDSTFRLAVLDALERMQVSLVRADLPTLTLGVVRSELMLPDRDEA